MLFQIRSYIKFILKSTNQHGVHSPFVYTLLSGCFYNKSKQNWYKKIDDYRNSLLKSNDIIEIEDFGAGSKTLQNHQRKVSEITKNAGITIKRAKLLNRIVSYFKTENILEIGTSLGIATAAMAINNPKASIKTLEGCPNTSQIAIDHFEKFDLKNIEILIGNFNKTLSKTLNNEKFDLIYFDGNHQMQATIDYFEECIKHKHNESIFIFDDIYWSKGMQQAWQYIKEHQEVTVSIDTYYWGVVFFRKEQEKEHFVVRV